MWKGKVTSVKVHPFDSSGRGVKVEITYQVEQGGQLSGQEIGTAYSQQALDGTASVSYAGVLTTSEGDTVLVAGLALFVSKEGGSALWGSDNHWQGRGNTERAYITHSLKKGRYTHEDERDCPFRSH